MELVTTILVVAVVTWILLRLVPVAIRRARFIRMLNALPGPKSYPLIGTFFAWYLPRNRILDAMREMVEEFGFLFVFWLGPHAVVNLSCPQHMETILGNPQHNEKSIQYTFLEPWLGTGLLTSKGRKWHSHRKMITPTFHFQILDSFVEVFSEKSEILVQKLNKQVGGNSFDVYPYITKCALDIICETAMGTQMDIQLQEVESNYVRAIYNVSEMTMRRMLSPLLYLDFLFRLSPLGRRYSESINILHNFTNKVIREKKQFRKAVKAPESSDEDLYLGLKKKRKAFLDLLLEAVEHGYQLTDEELREEVDTFMFEGHDTTTAAMCWALHLLGFHPAVQDKVHEELDNIFQGSDRSVTMKDLNDMKYLELVVKETLRLYPSVPMIGRIIRKDVKIGEFTIPAGVTVMANIYFLHRNPEYFPDPEKFKPERFLPENVARRHPYAHIPFSAGPRNCIGQKFALMEEKTVLSYILRNFTVRAKNENLTLLPELILRSEQGIPITLSRRQVIH